MPVDTRTPVQQTPRDVSDAPAYTCRLHDDIDQLDLDVWKVVCDNDVRNNDDALMDPRFLRAAQRAVAHDADGRMWHLVVYDADSVPVACACLSQTVLDAAMLGQRWFEAYVSLFRRVFPRYLYLRVIFCGLPISTGGSHLRIAEGADADRVVNAVADSMQQLAGQQRAWLSVVKELTDRECDVAACFEKRGYLRASSLPMNELAHGFGSTAQYMSALRSHYRYKINGSRKKLARHGLRVEHLRDAERIQQLYTPQLHRLYEAVTHRAETQLEVLPREFFISLASQFDSQVVLTRICDDDRTVAFSWGLLAGQTYRNLFIGIDYDWNRRVDAYFNVMLAALEYAIDAGAKRLYFGQTADVFKSRLGCRNEARWICVRATAAWLDWCIRAASKLVFPLRPPAPRRNLFKPDAFENDSVS